MADNDMVCYLANLILVSLIDGKLDPREQQAIETISLQIGASPDDMERANRLVRDGEYKPTPVGRFCDKVRNLEDMIYLSVVDGQLPESQKKTVVNFAREIRVNQEQINIMLAESRQRVRLEQISSTCTGCTKELPSHSKFCPFCGERIGS